MRETNVTFIPESDAEKYTQEEIAAYVSRAYAKYGENLLGITLKTVEDDPDLVDIYYHMKNIPFVRLRRITGYLVGDMNRWNNAKRQEEHDRVKHA